MINHSWTNNQFKSFLQKLSTNYFKLLLIRLSLFFSVARSFVSFCLFRVYDEFTLPSKERLKASRDKERQRATTYISCLPMQWSVFVQIDWTLHCYYRSNPQVIQNIKVFQVFFRSMNFIAFYLFLKSLIFSLFKYEFILVFTKLLD